LTPRLSETIRRFPAGPLKRPKTDRHTTEGRGDQFPSPPSVLRGHLAHSFADWLQAFRRTKVYDLCAAAPLIAWYLLGAKQFVPLIAGEITLISLFIQTDVSVLPFSLVLSALSKICSLAFLVVLVVMFALRRPPKLRSKGLYARFVALAGTWVGVGIVQLPPQQLSSLGYFASILLLIAGMTFATCSVLALARSVSIMPEARQLVMRGPYSLVRHPLYLGEMAANAGLAIQYLMPWALVVLAAHCFFQFERMKNEERVLMEAFPEYKGYTARTARLLPGLY
jgi:protein-S-isoprenylcysteine O-methyltransferase Ste14